MSKLRSKNPIWRQSFVRRWWLKFAWWFPPTRWWMQRSFQKRWGKNLQGMYDACSKGDDYPKHVWTPETGWVHEEDQ